MDELKDPVERINFFSGQLLNADDFRSEQDYHRSKAHLHNRMLHGSGIVGGLEVTSDNDRLNVRPGLAIDGYGREISVAEPQTVDVPTAPTAPGTLWLCLCYHEAAVDPISAPDGVERHPTRIREGFTLAFTDPDRCPEGCILLAEVIISGRTVKTIVDGVQRIPRVADLVAEVTDLKRRLNELKQ